MDENDFSEIKKLLGNDLIQEATIKLLNLVESSDSSHLLIIRNLIIQSAIINNLKKDIQGGLIDWDFNRLKRNIIINNLFDISQDLYNLGREKLESENQFLGNSHLRINFKFEYIGSLILGEE
jgi:hypothetical protein